MRRHRFLLLLIALWSATGCLLAPTASAQVPLTRAVIEALRNRVRLMPQRRTVRPASLRDIMNPGDGLATGQSSLAELRFNDGSLARVGEQVVFWFVPQTRTFRLSNGTMLLLVPPGRGRTHLQTPNVTTGIQGSALFVRYIEETDTTIVGALTDSGIVVSNRDGSQQRALAAGELAVVVEDEIEQLYDFDLETFYETSDLVRDLYLDQGTPPSQDIAVDPAIAAVQAETIAALQAQTPVPQEGAVENPSFIQMPAAAAPPAQTSTSAPPSQRNNPDQPLPSNQPVTLPRTVQTDTTTTPNSPQSPNDTTGSTPSPVQETTPAASPSAVEDPRIEVRPVLEAGEVHSTEMNATSGGNNSGVNPNPANPADPTGNGIPPSGGGIGEEPTAPNQGSVVGDIPGSGEAVSGDVPDGGDVISGDVPNSNDGISGDIPDPSDGISGDVPDPVDNIPDLEIDLPTEDPISDPVEDPVVNDGGTVNPEVPTDDLPDVPDPSDLDNDFPDLPTDDTPNIPDLETDLPTEDPVVDPVVDPVEDPVVNDGGTVSPEVPNDIPDVPDPSDLDNDFPDLPTDDTPNIPDLETDLPTEDPVVGPVVDPVEDPVVNDGGTVNPEVPTDDIPDVPDPSDLETDFPELPSDDIDTSTPDLEGDLPGSPVEEPIDPSPEVPDSDIDTDVPDVEDDLPTTDDPVDDSLGEDGTNTGDFPGRGNGVTDENGNGVFPGRGNGVTDENGNGVFPGRGNGVTDD